MPSQALSQPNQATPAPIRRLPHQLLSLIFELCDTFPQRKSALRALCLVSKDFYKSAAPVLYGGIRAMFGEKPVYWPNRVYRLAEVTMNSAQRWVVPGPHADPDRQAKARIPTLPNLHTAVVCLDRSPRRGPADYSEGALLTLAQAAPNLRIPILHKLDDQLSTTLKKVAKLGDHFWEAWPKLEKLIISKWWWESLGARETVAKVAKEAEAWGVKIEHE
ncbi:hypothetical protein JCM10296v2_006121 [Rhodotorula toruloides]